LRVSASKKVFGLPIGYLYAPSVGTSLDDLQVGGVRIRFKQDHVRIFPVRVTYKHDRENFISTDPVPDSVELFGQYHRLLAIQFNEQCIPSGVAVIEPDRRLGKLGPLLPWAASSRRDTVRFGRCIQDGIFAHFARDVDARRPVLHHGGVGISPVNDDPKGYFRLHPRAGKHDQFQRQFGLGLV
jgi:hypothetical protein